MAGLNGRIGTFSLDEKLLLFGNGVSTSPFKKHSQNTSCFVEMCPTSIQKQLPIQEHAQSNKNSDKTQNVKIGDKQADNEKKQELAQHESSTDSALKIYSDDKTKHDNVSRDIAVKQILNPILPAYNWDGTGGCLTCGMDDDYALLLICELCNGEYHTYCLNPPLESVPEGDFYCGRYYF